MTATRTTSSLRALALTVLLLFTGAVAAAQASAAPATAWEPLAASSPTNLAPVQSEIQRVGVDAEDGDYTLTYPRTATGSGTLAVTTVTDARLTAGSNEVRPSVDFGVLMVSGTLAIGQEIVGPGIPAGTTITNITSFDLTFLGLGIVTTGITLSANATQDVNPATLKAGSRVVTGVTTSSGTFGVGDRISGTGIPTGTTITATGAGTLTLSQLPTASGSQNLTADQVTAPIPFNADAATVEAALDALGALEVSVTGGPGDSGASTPYNVAFDGGGLENTNVAQLSADGAGLTGGVQSRAFVYTSLQGGPGTGEVVIFAQNVGGTTSTGTTTIDFTLPPGVVATAGPADVAVGTGNLAVWTCDGGAGATAMSCDKTAAAPQAGPGLTLSLLAVPVRTTAGATGGEVEIEVSGGGALGIATYEMPLQVTTLDAPPGLQSYSAGAYKEDGTPDTRAGAHPFAASAAFLVNTKRASAGGVVPVGELRDIIVDTPPGFVGNPLATEQCPEALDQAECPFASGVGTAQVMTSRLSSGGFRDLVNNIQAPVGYPAKFRFKTGLNQIVINVPASVRSDEDYGVSAGPRDTPQIRLVYGSFFTVWGTPADSAHDDQRCTGGFLEPPCGPGGENIAFLTNPVDCAIEAAVAPVAGFNFLSWQYPGQPFDEDFVLPAVTGCDQLDDFRAPGVDLNARPTTNVADSPTGLDVDLRIPQENINDPDDTVTPHLRHTTVALPQGIAINPSGANGLDGCSSAEIGLLGTNFPGPHSTRFTKVPSSCPDASKVGVVEVETPVFDHPLPGTVYVADPFDNPFRSLLAIYLEVDDRQTGIVAKLAGSVDLDPRTGQISSTFLNNPQVPFSEFRLDFSGGANAPLVTPPTCGTYQTRSTLTPWSAPDSGPPVTSIDTYQITQGPSGACASSPAALPNSPTLNAGTSSAIAGAYSPFVVNLSRADGTQRFRDVTITPPQGLVAKLAGVPYCSDAALAAAENREGKAEQAAPSCPVASKLGEVHAAAGAGPDPYNAPGTAYLAGPYKGAPLSMAIITPAVAGPFDLGVVVIRTALHVNPKTAEITAVSDPLPELLDGIPLNIRSASVRINRPEFTKNPTSCDPMAVSGQLTSTLGNTAQLTNRFQVGECARLGFKPNLVLRLKGGTKRGRYPQLTATMKPRAGDANIRSVSVAFPRSEFLANEHIRTICTRPDFAADNCPAGSIYGTSTVTTPLLDYPLTGNVYLRSSDNLLPDVVPDLRGPAHQPIRVEAAGRTDSIRGGIRNTFDFFPDAPFSRAILRMQGGNKGLLVNSRDICRRAYRAEVEFIAHNGLTHTIRPMLIAQGCKGKSAKKAKRRG